MKKVKGITNFSLPAYAAFASCFLDLHKETAAQVVYVDIDPDSILDERLEFAALDIDGNGTIDFAFLNSSFTYYNESWFSYRLRQDILAGPYISANAIAGNSVHFSTGYGGYTWTFPYALSVNYLLGNLLQWHNTGEQILAIRTFYQSGAIYNYCGQCYWYNSVITETFDHYLGVRFLDDLDQNHYGWIRCDVKDEGRTLIIKDYAYELQTDYPIIVGSKEHYVDINNLQNTLDANVYSFNNNIYINTNNWQNTKVDVYDLSGKKLISKLLSEQFSVLNMNDGPSEIYIL